MERMVMMMTMKNKDIIFWSSGDQHFGKEDNDRLYKELSVNFLDKIMKANDVGELPNVIFLDGDLFHKIIRFTDQSGRLVINFIERLLYLTDMFNIQLRIIKGTRSHDYNQLNMLHNYEATYPNFRIYETATKEEITLLNHPNKDLKLKTLFLPEEYPKDKETFYKEFMDDHYDTIQGHGTIDFVNIPGSNYQSDFESDMKTAPIWDSKKLIDLSDGPIIFGHIHNFTKYKNKIYYTSSFTKYSFSDKGDKGFLKVTMDPDDRTNYNVERIINDKAPTYAIINIDEENFETAEEKVAYINQMKKEYDHVRIDSDDPDNVKIIKKIVEHNPEIKVKLKNKKAEETKVDDKYKFLLDPNNKNSISENIQQFIKNEYDKEVPLSIIENIINPKMQVDPELIDSLANKKD